MSLRPRGRGERAPVPRCWGSRRCTRGWPTGLRTRCRSSSTRTSRATPTRSPAPLGYGADAICPRLALETVARWRRTTGSAATGRLPLRRSDGSSPPSRRACSRSCPRWASRTSRATAARASSTRSASSVTSAGALPRRHAVALAARASSASSRRRSSGSRPRRGAAKAREPGLLQVPQGRRGARDRSGRRRRPRRRGAGGARASERRYAKAARTLRALRGARQRTAAARAARPARAGPGRTSRAARGGRACLGDRAPLLERSDVTRSPLGGKPTR